RPFLCSAFAVDKSSRSRQTRRFQSHGHREGRRRGDLRRGERTAWRTACAVIGGWRSEVRSDEWRGCLVGGTGFNVICYEWDLSGQISRGSRATMQGTCEDLISVNYLIRCQTY